MGKTSEMPIKMEELCHILFLFKSTPGRGFVILGEKLAESETATSRTCLAGNIGT